MRATLLTIALLSTTLLAQTPAQPDWAKLDEETLRHYLAIIRMDTTDPPGGEKPVVDYLKQVLEAEGIAVQTFALEPHRPNLVARIKGSGKQRPLLLMGHSDTVNVDPKKWIHHLRPRHGGRQGQRHRPRDDHADAQAAERETGSRRHPAD